MNPYLNTLIEKYFAEGKPEATANLITNMIYKTFDMEGRELDGGLDEMVFTLITEKSYMSDYGTVDYMNEYFPNWKGKVEMAIRCIVGNKAKLKMVHIEEDEFMYVLTA